MSLLLTDPQDILEQKFRALQTREDIALLLDITDYQLKYYLYIIPKKNRYVEFSIPKKSGGTRKISAPNGSLKIIQQKLNQVLLSVYPPKAPVHSFLPNKSIVSNAEKHLRRKYVLNLDLIDFFPSINFGRVRGMFIAAPYNCIPEVATVLAQICCHNNQLPQGAPTSPIVSNMICAKLDQQLLQLARHYRCTYTRYADDLTFSTSMPIFPMALAQKSTLTGQLEVGSELARLIDQNGFKINLQKLRLQTHKRRQEVTGLVTNKKVNVRRSYIRQLRAMLNNWEKHSLKLAASDFFSRYDRKKRTPSNEEKFFKRVVKGKLDFLKMVRGDKDEIYLRYRDKLKNLAPELVKDDIEEAADTRQSIPVMIVTEGKTDWKHLKAALQYFRALGIFKDLNIKFSENLDESKQGDNQLITHCEYLAQHTPLEVNIAIFDRDTPKTMEKAKPVDQSEFKVWGKKVYSIILPIPSHRKHTPNVCIELYYTDKELQRADDKERRLYLSNEFHPESAKLQTDLRIHTRDHSKLKSSELKIIDNNVFNHQHTNVALPKSDFADNILDRKLNFDDFNFTEFEKIFEIIKKIIERESLQNSQENT